MPVTVSTDMKEGYSTVNDCSTVYWSTSTDGAHVEKTNWLTLQVNAGQNQMSLLRNALMGTLWALRLLNLQVLR